MWGGGGGGGEESGKVEDRVEEEKVARGKYSEGGECGKAGCSGEGGKLVRMKLDEVVRERKRQVGSEGRGEEEEEARRWK